LSKKHHRQVHKNEFHTANWFVFGMFCGWTTHHTAKVSEEVNRKLPVKNTTAVQLFTVHNDPDYHNAQRYRQTDRWTERPTGHRRTTSWCQ